MRSLSWLGLSLALMACGGSPDPGAPDSGAAPAADADPDPSVPACIPLPDEPTSCRECLGGPPLAADASACTATVCDLDPSCCQTLWDARCTKLADTACEIDRCLDTVAFTGWFNVTVGQWQAPALVSEYWRSTDDRVIGTADWADHDGDGLADAVIASDCFVRVLRSSGWSGDQIALAPVYSLDLGCWTDEEFGGRVARWFDADSDGDLDIVVGGVQGGFWIEKAGDDFVRAGDLIAHPNVLFADLAVGDLEANGRADVVALSWRFDPATGETTQTLDRFEYDPTSGTFVADPGWGQQLHRPGNSHLRGCDVAGDRGRELVLSGTLSVFAHNVFGGELGDPAFALAGITGPVACANLDGDPRDEVVVSRDVEGGVAVQILDGGAVVWSSDTDLPEPWLVSAGGLEAADLDGDGDVDIMVAEAGELGELGVLWNQGGEPLAFVRQGFGDRNDDHDINSAQVLHLPPPPR